MATQIRQENGITILEPSGKLVGTAVLDLRKVISPQIEAVDAPRILINFENVNMIDSSGLGALLEARAYSNRNNGRIGVINVGKHIKNLVVLSRLVSMFEHYENEDVAIAALAA